MLYIGKRPTFDNGESRSIEVNIFDLDENLYGSDIAVDLIARTRGDKKFDTMEGLAAQLHLDARGCNRILAEGMNFVWKGELSVYGTQYTW